MHPSAVSRILLLPVLAALLASSLAAPRPAASAVQGSSGPLIVMPPHPRVEEAIAAGLVEMPTEHRGSSPEADGPQAVSPALAPAAPISGTIRALAVLVEFTDKPHQVGAAFFDSLIFAAPVPGRGSVRDYYSEVSYGQVDIITVNLPSSIGWQTAPGLYSSYVDSKYCTDGIYPKNCQKLAEDVAGMVDNLVDFKQYDNDGNGRAEPILIVHSGPGAEFSENVNDIWSHSWDMLYGRTRDGVWVDDYVIMPEYWIKPGDMTIGVFAHEMGHGFWDLPDLYDYDNSSDGVGDWSLMAGGSWNGTIGRGDSPAWPDAWTRIAMGFATPQAIVAPRAYSAPQPPGNPGVPVIYSVRTLGMGAQEYFLIENRQRAAGTYDEYLPGSGLLIWHVDDALKNLEKPNNTECDLTNHRQVVNGKEILCAQHALIGLEQADRLFELERNGLDIERGDSGDPYPGSTGNTSFTFNTTPGTHSYYTLADPALNITGISASGPTMSFTIDMTPEVLTRRLSIPLVMDGAGPAAAAPVP